MAHTLLRSGASSAPALRKRQDPALGGAAEHQRRSLARRSASIVGEGASRGRSPASSTGGRLPPLSHLASGSPIPRTRDSQRTESKQQLSAQRAPSAW